jgi:hypothetical protein
VIQEESVECSYVRCDLMIFGYDDVYFLGQDSQDPNPLIRALAVRTMGCIRVDKITEYLCDPLQRCLKVSS